MRRVSSLVLIVSCLLLMGGNCSRARVESLNEMNAGVDMATRQRYHDAIEHLQRASALDPENDQAFVNLGHVYVKMGKHAAARDAFQQATALKPLVAENFELLGSVLVELGEWKAALGALSTAIDIAPQSYAARYKLGRVHEELDDPQNALHAYTATIKKGPHFVTTYSALGRLYADLDYPDHAEQVLKAGLSLEHASEEDQANLHHLLGTVYQQKHDATAAIAQFKEALARVPGMLDALFSLGWTYAMSGDFTAAESYLKQYVSMAGGSGPTHYLKAARDRLSEIRMTRME